MQNVNFIKESMKALEAEGLRLYDEVEDLDYLIQDLEDNLTELLDRRNSKLEQIDKNDSIYCGLEELLNKIEEGEF